MKTFVMVVLGAVGAAAASRVPQDPPKPPPAAAPAAAPGERAAPKGPPARHALEGVYVLRTRTRAGLPETQPRCRGYVAITSRHLLLCLVAPGSDPELPLVRAGVRTWKPAEEQVQTEIELGFYTDEDGGIHLEEHGKKEPRRIELVRGGLRIWQDQRDWLEFERVE